MTRETDSATTKSTAGRLLEVLSAFRDGYRDLGVSELGNRLGLDKAVVHRLLQSLAEYRFIERDPNTRRYRVGVRAWEVGQRYAGGTRLEDKVVPLLTPLVESSGGTGYVATLDGADVVYLALINGPGPLRVHVDVGSRAPAHSGAVGKAMLAMLPDQDLRARLRNVDLPAVTSQTITSLDELLRDLERVRSTGYALNHGEYIEGVGSVGAAIVDSDSFPVAGISVAFPMLPAFEGLFDTLPPEVMRVARRVSRVLSTTR
jgi:DNA-binding IclR family transcriptional regulator